MEVKKQFGKRFIFHSVTIVIILIVLVGIPLFILLSEEDRDNAKRACVNWVSSEYEEVKYYPNGEFKRKQGDELIFTVWGKEYPSAATENGITCVYNLKTHRMTKPSIFNQSYN